MNKGFVYLLILSLVISVSANGQATLNCFPEEAEYHTGSTDGADFTETSYILSTGGDLELGWARFDISDIPEGATIQSVELNLYVSADNYPYWYVTPITFDPLDASASDLYTEIIDGETSNYFQYNSGNIESPAWWSEDLGSNAATDLQSNLDNEDHWFAVGIYDYDGSTTYWIQVDGWDEDNPPYLTVSYLIPGAPVPPSNPYPSDLAYGVDVDVTMTWDFGDDSETYDLYFGTEFPLTSLVVVDETAGAVGSYSPETLEYQTTYYWQVVAKNIMVTDGTPGPVWNFTTACAAFEVPLFEDFELVSTPELPYCWTSLITSTSDYSNIQTLNSGGIDGSSSLRFYNSDDDEAFMFLITPAIDGGLLDKWIRFNAVGGAPEILVGTISDPSDISTISFYDFISITSSFNEYEVSFNNYDGEDEYIVLGVISTSIYQYTYLDDITIDYAPDCLKPQDLFANELGQTSVFLNWSEMGSAESWGIEYGLEGFEPTGIATVTVEDNPYELTALDANTTYEFYVQADCGEDTYSEWAGPASFTTLCDAVDLPFYENLDDLTAPELPDCWLTMMLSGNAYATIQTNAYSAYTSPNCLYIYNSGDADAEAYVVLPQMEVPDGSVSDLWIQFYAWGYAEDITIGTMTDPSDASSFTPYATFPLTGLYLEYQTYEVAFGGYEGEDEFIALMVDWTETYDAVYVDDISVDYAPSCPKPFDLVASNIDAYQVDLSWTEGGEASLWNIEYGEFGFEPAGIANEEGVLNPFTLSDLDPGTTYEYYVQSDCGEGDVSEWSGPFAFTTLCDAFEVPVFEDIEAAIIPELPPCWSSLVNSTSTYSVVQSYAYNALSLTNSIRFYNSNDMDAVNILVFPDMIDDVEDLYLNFFAYGGPTISIGTMTDPLDETTYTEYVSYPTSGDYLDYAEYEVLFDNYSEDDEFIAMKATWSATYQYIYLDDITIDIPPTCPKPSNLVVSELTTTGAIVEWTENGDATEWDIEYGEQGFEPTGEVNIVADSNPFELSDLDSGTAYEFYVRASCAEDDVSYWVGPQSFSTLCEAISVPYYEGFEDVIVPDVPPCISVQNLNEDTYYWYTNTTNPYEGTNHMYIGYNYSEAMDDWFFSAPLDLVGGETYQLQFYYTTNSTYTWFEKLEVLWGSQPNSSDMTEGPIFTDEFIQFGYVYQEGMGTFSPEEDGVYFIGWHGYSDANMYYLYVDEITVDAAPTCPKPSDLEVLSTTETTAWLGWTENGDATAWNIEYGYTGFEPSGEGNEIADSNPYELTGLEASTVYEFYVQSECGSEDVSWWEGPFEFMTQCGATDLPYTVDFESASVPELPPCTSMEDVNEDDKIWITSTSNPNNGTNHMSITYNGSMAMNDWFFTAPLNLLGGSEYIVEFYYTNNSSYYTESLEVKWGTETSADDMYSEVLFYDDGINYNGEYQYGFGLFTPEEDGIYYIGWHGYSIADQFYLYVDDISISFNENTMSVTVSADPMEMCEGDEVNLSVQVNNGTGNYTYSWTCEPPGFNSTEQYPTDIPLVNTTYYCEVDDGEGTAMSEVSVLVNPLPVVSLDDFGEICSEDEPLELIGGVPEGGVYSGVGVTDAYFDPAGLETGLYTIMYTYMDENGCENFEEAEIEVVICTGLDNLSVNIHIDVFPNPNKGLFTIEVRSSTVKKVDLKIVNNFGDLIYEEKNVTLNDNYRSEIDLSNFAKGIYFIYIVTDKGTTLSKLVIE